MFFTLSTAVVFHFKVADETLWGRKVSHFFHFSAITQRPQAGWTQGLRAKRFSARRSVSAYMCTCVRAWPLSTFCSQTHSRSLCSLHTKINDKPSWSHLVFLSRLHLIACFPCLLNLIHNPLVPPCWLSPLISLFPLMLSIIQSMLSYIWEGHVCYAPLSRTVFRSHYICYYACVRSPHVHMHVNKYTVQVGSRILRLNWNSLKLWKKLCLKSNVSMEKF